MTTNTDWIHEGARVAIVTDGAHRIKVDYDTVIEISQRHVATSKNGTFTLKDLKPSGSRTWDTATVRLMDPADPHVANVKAKIRIRKLGITLEKITSGFLGGEAEALAILDEIEQAVRAARQAITGKEN